MLDSAAGGCLAGRLRSKWSEGRANEVFVLQLSASIGISLYPDDIDLLIRHADDAT